MGSDIFQRKRELRLQIKKLKAQLPASERLKKSNAVFSQVENLEIFNTASTILIYWSLPDEVQTHEFILKHKSEKRFVLPVINDNFLELKLFTGVQNMKPGKGMSIPEPEGEVFGDYDEIGLAIIPGVAFDSNNNRLGHGKAYYDKLLPQIKAFKTGVCFDFQLVDTVPVTPSDIRMDMVITG
ncbi:MAG: 5-formyltetrahydrofolate cyclo-ligase [Bacteroidales bacterium]|nr:5-formyltetrahydrofolate cyclo-ligase [Bacteroidales bacterium]